jgi:hypothetical protein
MWGLELGYTKYRKEWVEAATADEKTSIATNVDSHKLASNSNAPVKV